MADAVQIAEFVALQRALAGRYSLERELGRGGMGVVYLARDVALDRPVAIKLLPPALAADPARRRRFLEEARTAARLAQPNIVPIHAVEEAAGLVYFVMGFVEGETLGERLRARGPLTPQEAARMLQEVAWALGYAHGRGVIHRDVKPDNIMLERGTGRAVVMDFGIAARTVDAAGGEVLGTAQYISPEQANGDPVDGRSDIYALGVVGFLALSGRLPFTAADTTGLLAMHVARPAPPLAAVAASVPSRLARAVDRCLRKSPADRFPTGEALAEAIAQTVERRRELPVPVRIWLTKGQESKVAYLLWYFGIGTVPSMALFSFLARPLGVSAALTGALGLYFGAPFALHAGYRTWRLRRLLAEGYSLDDARLAVRDVAERRREELTYEFGAAPPAWARFVYRATFVAGGVSIAGLVTLVLSVGRLMGWPLQAAVSVTVGAGTAALLGYIVHRIRPGKPITRDLAAELRLKFWSSKFARWLERFARVGLTRRATPAELTYRPTELALGLAADALFESLAKAQRKELKELPPLIERLQRDAGKLRQTVDELNGALAGLGEPGATRHPDLQAASVVDTRERLRADLTRQRDQAAGRLATTVAALEGIRLNLLRLKAGTGSVAELTVDLAAARDVMDALSRSADAAEQVEALLGGVRAITGELPREPRRG